MVDSSGHMHSTFKTTNYTEGWSSENKRICILTKHLLSGENYELTQEKVFDMRWSSMVKRPGENVGMCVDSGSPTGMPS